MKSPKLIYFENTSVFNTSLSEMLEKLMCRIQKGRKERELENYYINNKCVHLSNSSQPINNVPCKWNPKFYSRDFFMILIEIQCWVFAQHICVYGKWNPWAWTERTTVSTEYLDNGISAWRFTFIVMLDPCFIPWHCDMSSCPEHTLHTSRNSSYGTFDLVCFDIS